MSLVLPGPDAGASHTAFGPGDLFVSLSTGQVQWRHPDGSLNRVLTGVLPGRAGGMDFDAAGNLYVTHWCEGSPLVPVCTRGGGVEAFSPQGAPLGPFGSGYDCNPYSLRFDPTGRLFVGQADCTGDILTLGADGALEAAYDVPTDRGSSWIELGADGCTVFYTAGTAPRVQRYDLCAGSPLPDFNAAPLPDPSAKVLRRLPDGGLLVTNVTAVVRLDAAGQLVQTYGVAGEAQAWGWVDLVGDGTFWASNHFSSNVYRFSLATGEVLASFNASPADQSVIGVAVAPGPGAGSPPVAFAPGDLFLSLSTGQVQWRRPDGTLKAVLAGQVPGRAGGMAFDPAGNLYVTHGCEGLGIAPACPSGGGVEVFGPSGSSLGAFGSGYDCNPYSIRLDGVGRAYVGQSDCGADVLVLDAGGAVLAAHDAATEARGTDGVDLAADGCTIVYTSRGVNVKRFDACAGAQLADFNAAPLPGPAAYAVRVLPDGGVLVADVSAVVRLDAAGHLAQTYAVPGEPEGWEWLDLVGDGTFWAINHHSSNAYRFSLATGEVLAGFNASDVPFTLIGVAVKP
jgi:outer membrane protein assembly factor BamB